MSENIRAKLLAEGVNFYYWPSTEIALAILKKKTIED
jgi:hypothetical protein